MSKINNNEFIIDFFKNNKDYELIEILYGRDIGYECKKKYIKFKHLYCGNISVCDIYSFITTSTCKRCCKKYENSFAHYIEVELGLNINDVWDFEKNTLNPYHISKNSHKDVFIKCQNEEVNELNGLMKKDYHSVYNTNCYNFIQGNRCSYCSSRSKKHDIHPYDSFGYHNFDKIMSWCPDNDISPFKVSVYSHKKYKFICHECGTKFSHALNNLSQRGDWCPICSSSKGEKRVKAWLDYNNINYIHDEPYFEDLVGTGGGLLRPDFILPEHRIWIEYDGEFHYKDFYKDGSYETLKIHDKRKDGYAKEHGWKLIRIPYKKFNNIEEILEREIS